jgi:hypothetical protein
LHIRLTSNRLSAASIKKALIHTTSSLATKRQGSSLGPEQSPPHTTHTYIFILPIHSRAIQYNTVQTNFDTLTTRHISSTTHPDLLRCTLAVHCFDPLLQSLSHSCSTTQSIKKKKLSTILWLSLLFRSIFAFPTRLISRFELGSLIVQSLSQNWQHILVPVKLETPVEAQTSLLLWCFLSRQLANHCYSSTPHTDTNLPTERPDLDARLSVPVLERSLRPASRASKSILGLLDADPQQPAQYFTVSCTLSYYIFAFTLSGRIY